MESHTRDLGMNSHSFLLNFIFSMIKLMVNTMLELLDWMIPLKSIIRHAIQFACPNNLHQILINGQVSKLVLSAG